MGSGFRFCLLLAASALFAGAFGLDARAADLRPGAVALGPGAAGPLALECDDGRVYPIRPRAVSVAGELVTGWLVTGPRRQAAFRLVPMGTGYRYAGAGFWFDGVRGEATLEISRAMTACIVTYD